MNRWKSGYPKLVPLIKPWSQQYPILFLNIQVSSKIVWFEMLRANHWILRQLPTCTFRFMKSKSIHCLRFYYSLLRGDHRHKMVWYEAQYPLVSFLCCCIPQQHIWVAFLRTLFAAFPTKTSKCAKYRIIAILILHHIRPLAQAR